MSFPVGTWIDPCYHEKVVRLDDCHKVSVRARVLAKKTQLQREIVKHVLSDHLEPQGTINLTNLTIRSQRDKRVEAITRTQ
jgi:hypothetical protein